MISGPNAGSGCPFLVPFSHQVADGVRLSVVIGSDPIIILLGFVGKCVWQGKELPVMDEAEAPLTVSIDQ